MNNFVRLIDKISRRSRLLFSLLTGFIVFLIVRHTQTTAYTFLVSWIGFASCSLFFSWVTILGKHPMDTAKIAATQDANYLVIFTAVVSAAFISLFAIILILHSIPSHANHTRNIHMAPAVVAITLSWLLMHTLFTIHYARVYFTVKPGLAAQKTEYVQGLLFPGNEVPDFLDFAYFSFVVGMTFQVSDVNITGRTLRRLVLIHSFLSFVYNTAIIAFSINIISGLLGK